MPCMFSIVIDLAASLPLREWACSSSEQRQVGSGWQKLYGKVFPAIQPKKSRETELCNALGAIGSP